ncbi:MAG: phage tail tape measure protein [Kofleriaceae bacterium]|nr:phage tail tape measure protein [Kofleriaceae bacterium]
MALNLGLGFLLSARDLASGVFERVGSKLRGLSTGVDRSSARMDQALTGVGDSLGRLAAGVGGALGGAASLRDAASFDDALRQILAVSGATAEEMRQIEDAALRVGASTQFSATEAAVGIRDLSQAGYLANEALEMLVPVLDLAASSLGELTPQDAAGLAAQTLKAFGLEAKDASRAVDTLLQSVNLFALAPRELPLALGTASRGAQSANQSLEETLITLGLVKNVIPGVERASTAVAVAMGEMATPKAQRALRGVGVAVTDSEGRFRDFLDVLVDLEPALGRMTEQRRAAFLRGAFGTEALGGVLAVSQQLRSGIRTASGEVVRGADAVAYLRDQFQEADGTAARFRDTLLGGFRGQWTLFVGSLKTLALAVGKPVLEIVTPVVTRLAAAARALTHAFLDLPPSVRKGIAVVVAAVAGLGALAGTLAAVRSASGLLRIGLGALGVQLGGLSGLLGPVLLAVGALALALAGLKSAYEKNLGGFRDFVVRAGAVISMTLRGLGQLFTDGGFSGPLREDLRRAENLGIRQFLVTIYMLVHRVRALVGGVAQGFRSGLETARPIFDGFAGAVRELAGAFTHLVRAIVGGSTNLPSDEFRAFGQAMGQALAGVVAIVTKLATIALRMTGGILDGFAAMWTYVGPAIMTLRDALGDLVDTFLGLFGASDGLRANTKSSTSAFRTLGLVLGKIVGGALTAVVLAAAGLAKVLTAILRVFDEVTSAIARDLRRIIDGVGMVVRFLTQDVPNAFRGLLNGIASVFEGVYRFLLQIRDAVIDIVNTIERAISSIGGTLDNAWRSVKGAPGRAWRGLTGGVGDLLSQADAGGGLRVLAPAGVPGAVPTRSGVELVASEGATRVAAVASRVRSGGDFDLNVRLDVDGETLARVVERVRQDEAARGFAPGAVG